MQRAGMLFALMLVLVGVARAEDQVLTLYRQQVGWNDEITDAWLKVDKRSRRVWVEVDMHEITRDKSDFRWRETGPTVRDLAYLPSRQTIIYTGPEGDQQVVCGRLVTRWAVIGSWEEVALTPPCTLDFFTREEPYKTGGRLVGRNYGTVVMRIHR